MAAQTKRETQLPIYRIKTIMKSSPGVENVSTESVHLIAKATELFIRHLAKESFLVGDLHYMQYKNVAQIVHKDHRLEFLRDMIPHKITVRRYKEIMKEKNQPVCDGSSSDSESSSSDSSSGNDSDGSSVIVITPIKK